MPVRARRWLRRMKGGSQPHLIEADDGYFYVIKPKDNPQHRRILVNEWISAVFLRYLQIGGPEVAPVFVAGEFIGDHPELAVQRGHRMEPISPGLAFRFPPAWRSLTDYSVRYAAERAALQGCQPARSRWPVGIRSLFKDPTGI